MMLLVRQFDLQHKMKNVTINHLFHASVTVFRETIVMIFKICDDFRYRFKCDNDKCQVGMNVGIGIFYILT